MTNVSSSDNLVSAVAAGFCVLDTRADAMLVHLVRTLAGAGYPLLRDVRVGPAESGATLSPHEGDFWFHSDGVFLPLPPRWVVIQLLHSEGGGALSLLDASALCDRMPATQFWFGKNSQGVRAPVVDTTRDLRFIRYRRDYMHGVIGADSEAAAAVHDLIERESNENAISIGELEVGYSLVVDNWRFLHRRAAFIGDRIIRRLWFGNGWPI